MALPSLLVFQLEGMGFWLTFIMIIFGLDTTPQDTLLSKGVSYCRRLELYLVLVGAEPARGGSGHSRTLKEHPDTLTIFYFSVSFNNVGSRKNEHECC